MESVYVDTNIFDYVALKHETYGEACKQITDDIGVFLNCYCSILIPVEILGSLSEIDVEKAYKAIIAFFSFDIRLINITETLVMEAKDIVKQTRINGYDAIHVAAMKQEDVKVIITENERDFKKADWIEIVKPLDYVKWKSNKMKNVNNKSKL